MKNIKKISFLLLLGLLVISFSATVFAKTSESVRAGGGGVTGGGGYKEMPQTSNMI